VAALPHVTSRIINMVEDPNSTPGQLNEIIRHDPALAARLLKVVNSAFYGMPKPIDSIEHAILVLGMKGVKNIAIAASLGPLFGKAAICDGYVAQDLWVHSIAVAVAARELALTTKSGRADEAFLAALIHDIGLLVTLQARPGELRAICDIALERDGGERDFCALERRIIGFDHQALGMGLAARWRLPRSCQLVAGHHHEPATMGLDTNRSLVTLVRVADTLCCHAGHGFSLTALHQPLDVAALAEMRVDPSAVSQTRDRLDALVAQAIALFG
jgi:HD-like signal output (HDOD) protein